MSERSRCLPDSIQNKDEMTRMSNGFEHSNLFQNLEFALFRSNQRKNLKKTLSSKDKVILPIG